MTLVIHTFPFETQNCTFLADLLNKGTWLLLFSQRYNHDWSIRVSDFSTREFKYFTRHGQKNGGARVSLTLHPYLLTVKMFSAWCLFFKLLK